MKQKLAAVLKRVYGLGQTALIGATLLILLGYIAAFIIGGETAVTIDTFLYGKVLPVLFFIAVALAFVGILVLYLTGYRTFRFESVRKK